MKKALLGFILGIIVTSGTVFAVSAIQDSSEIPFDNTGTTLSSTNVSDALKELNNKLGSGNTRIGAARASVSGQTLTINFAEEPKWIYSISSRGTGDTFFYNSENGKTVTHVNSTSYMSDPTFALTNHSRGYYNSSGGSTITISGTTLVLKYLDGSNYTHMFYYGY